MNYSYVVDKNLLDYIPEEVDNKLSIYDISTENSLYSKLIEILSIEKLDISDKFLYLPLEIKHSQELTENYKNLRDKYIANKFDFKDITTRTEYISNDNQYVTVFFTLDNIIYIRKDDYFGLLKELNAFQQYHHYVGNSAIIGSDIMNTENKNDIIYSDNEIKIKPIPNTVISTNNDNVVSFLPLRRLINRDKTVWHYNDIHDLSNIRRVENNVLPLHKLMRKNKRKILQILYRSDFPFHLNNHEINTMLADNSIPFLSPEHLTSCLQDFYKHKESYKSKKFHDLETALCVLWKMQNDGKNPILVDEKDQFHLHYYGEIPDVDTEECKEKISKLINEKDSSMNNGNIRDLLTLQEFNGKLVNSQQLLNLVDPETSNPFKLNMLDLISPKCYGINQSFLLRAAVEDNRVPLIMPYKVDFDIFNLDDKSVEIHIKDDKYSNRLIDDFYLENKDHNTMKKCLQNLWRNGKMLDHYQIANYHHYKNIDMKGVYLPFWFSSDSAERTKNILIFLSEI